MEKRTRMMLGAGLCIACGLGLLLVGSTVGGIVACLGGAGMLWYTLKQTA